MWIEIAVCITVIIVLVGMVCSIRKKDEKEKSYRNTIEEKFPDIKEYRVLFASESCRYICMNDELYVVVFSSTQPYSIVYSRMLDDGNLERILEMKRQQIERDKKR